MLYVLGTSDSDISINCRLADNINITNELLFDLYFSFEMLPLICHTLKYFDTIFDTICHTLKRACFYILIYSSNMNFHTGNVSVIQFNVSCTGIFKGKCIVIYAIFAMVLTLTYGPINVKSVFFQIEAASTFCCGWRAIRLLIDLRVKPMHVSKDYLSFYKAWHIHFHTQNINLPLTLLA